MSAAAEVIEALADALATALDVIAAEEAERPVGAEGDVDGLLLNGQRLVHQGREAAAILRRV